jgi:hypothetical protein
VHQKYVDFDFTKTQNDVSLLSHLTATEILLEYPDMTSFKKTRVGIGTSVG